MTMKLTNGFAAATLLGAMTMLTSGCGSMPIDTARAEASDCAGQGYAVCAGAYPTRVGSLASARGRQCRCSTLSPLP